MKSTTTVNKCLTPRQLQKLRALAIAELEEIWRQDPGKQDRTRRTGRFARAR